MTTYITFGLAGAGKTYFANWFSNKFNVHFEDADHWLTDEMKQYIRDDKVFTPEMLVRYFEVVSQKIAELKRQHKHLMISQALYLDQNRLQLLRNHTDIVYILVSVENDVLERRLLARKNGVSLEYARKNASYFESPSHYHINIDNSVDDSDSYLMAQCVHYEEIARLKNHGRLNQLFGPAIRSIRNLYARGVGRLTP